MRRLASAVAVVGATFAFAAQAHADSATIKVLTTDGRVDPVAGVSRIWSISGQATNRVGLMVKYRPVGGQQCAPTAETDSGRWLRWWYLSGGDANKKVEGVFDSRDAFVWEDEPGTFQFCIWLADRPSTIVTPITQVITIRRPTGTITATINPPVPQPGDPITVTVTGTSESPKRVFATYRPAGAPCAPNYSTDTGRGLIDGDQVDGTFSIPVMIHNSEMTAGEYVVCLWLADASYDSAPIAGPQPQPFSVVAPPPPPPRVSSGRITNCVSDRRLSRFRARRVRTVCARYVFSTAPQPGARVTVTFVRPNGRKHTTKRLIWSEDQQQPVIAGRLSSRAYRNRRGKWRAILRVDGRQLHTVSFTVRR